MPEIERIVIMGGGPGGIAAAAGLSHKGYNIRLYNLPKFEEAIKPIINRGGVEIEGDLGEEFVKIPIITTDIQVALEDAQLICIAVPGYGQKPMFEVCLPKLIPGQLVILMTGSAGSLEMALLMKEAGKSLDEIILGEMVVVPYSARMVGDERVRIRLPSDDKPKRLRVAAFPGRNTYQMVESLSNIFSLLPKHHVLDVGLNNPNFLIHPAPMLLNYAAVERADGYFSIMNEGMTEGVLRCLDAVDTEKMALQKALGLEVISIDDFYCEIGSGPQVYRKKGEPFGIRDRIWMRYIHEDVPYGMVLFASLGRMLGVPTPVSDSIINILSVVEQTDFWANGRTVECLGIAGMKLDQLIHYLETGERSA
jgi:opine dehydrogenase